MPVPGLAGWPANGDLCWLLESGSGAISRRAAKASADSNSGLHHRIPSLHLHLLSFMVYFAILRAAIKQE